MPTLLARHSLGVTKTESFDVAGNLVTLTLSSPIDSTIQTTNYEYDRRKRQTKITDADGGETNYRNVGWALPTDHI